MAPLLSGAAAGPGEERRQRVDSDRVRALQVALGSSFRANLAVGVLLVIAMSAFYDWPRLALWLTGLVLVQRYRWLLDTLGIGRASAALPESLRRVRRFEIDSLLLAAWWGGTVLWFFDPARPAVQLAVAHALGGVSLVSVGVHAYHPRVMRWFIPLVILPFVLRCFVQADLHHAYVGGGMLLLTTYLLLLGKHLAKVVRQAIELRHENSDLVLELRSQADRLSEASDAKSRFLAAASHDLRQPAHAVGLLSAALALRIDEPAQKALMDRLQASIHHFSDVVNEVLDIARLDVQGETLSMQPLPLEPLIGRVEAAFHELARAKGLALVIRWPDRLAPCVLADPAFVLRILSNLVANAVRYTRQGTVMIAVRPVWQGRNGPGGWCIQVRDSGPGIAREQHELVFEEFFQGHNPERDHRQGLGLGLAVARRMARMMGSDIGLRSCPGRGSVFSLVLGATEPPTQALEAIPVGAGSNPRGLRALVIDDDAMSREGLETLLRRWEVDTRSVASVTEAVACIGQGFAPQVVLSDHWLGHGDDAFSAIAAVTSALPAAQAAGLRVMVCSGDIRSTTQEAIRARGWHFLQKPVRPDLLEVWLRAGRTDASG